MTTKLRIPIPHTYDAHLEFVTERPLWPDTVTITPVDGTGKPLDSGRPISLTKEDAAGRAIIVLLGAYAQLDAERDTFKRDASTNRARARDWIDALTPALGGGRERAQLYNNLDDCAAAARVVALIVAAAKEWDESTHSERTDRADRAVEALSAAVRALDALDEYRKAAIAECRKAMEEAGP